MAGENEGQDTGTEASGANAGSSGAFEAATGSGPSPGNSQHSEEKQAAMLDVHAPHAAIHSWKDFFIHVATITVGLLIAIGLEQTVEYFHHLDQLQITRRELAQELVENRDIATTVRDDAQKIEAALDKDMGVLRASQALHTPLAGNLDFSWRLPRPRDGAWQVAKQNGSLALMPHAELQNDAHLYAVLDSMFEAQIELVNQLEAARAISRRSPDGALTAQDISDLVAATTEAQGKLAVAKKVLEFEGTALDAVH